MRKLESEKKCGFSNSVRPFSGVRSYVRLGACEPCVASSSTWHSRSRAWGGALKSWTHVQAHMAKIRLSQVFNLWIDGLQNWSPRDFQAIAAVFRSLKKCVLSVFFWWYYKMDSRIGLDYIVENAEYTTKLGAGKLEIWNIVRRKFSLGFWVGRNTVVFQLPDALLGSTFRCDFWGPKFLCTGRLVRG